MPIRYANLGGAGGGATALSGLTDVAQASVLVGQLMRYANGKWRNQIPGQLHFWDYLLDQLAGSAYVPSYRIFGVSITSGAAILTSVRPIFTAAMQGATIHVDQALATGNGVLVTTIQTYTSPTQVTLAASATATVATKGVARLIGTNVSAAVDAWLAAIGVAAASTPGGARGILPPGHYLVDGNHQIPDLGWIDGSGHWRSMFLLKASAGAGVDVLRSNGFTGFTGRTGTLNGNAGAYGFGLQQLGIDGNFRANSTARYGLAVYGFDYFLKDIIVTGASDSGIYSELNMTSGNTPHQLGTGPGGLHTYWDRVMVQNCADNGSKKQINFLGPHDSYGRGLDIYKDGNFTDYGLFIGHSGVGGGVDGGGGSQWSDIHVWGNHTTGVNINSGGTLMDNLQSEGGNLQLLIAGSKIKVNHARLYGVTGTGADEGLEFATSASDCQATNIKIENCDVAAVRFTGSGGTNSILTGTASSDNGTPPPLVAGTPPASLEADLVGINGYNRSLRQRGGGHAVASGDFGTLTGWGTGASVAVQAGSNVYRGSAAITVGTTPAATPTLILTFPKSFLATPFVMVNRCGTGTGGTSTFTADNISATSVRFQYQGTPTAAQVIYFTWMIQE